MRRQLILAITALLTFALFGCSSEPGNELSSQEAQLPKKELIGGVEAYIPDSWATIAESEDLIAWDVSNGTKHAVASISLYDREEHDYNPAIDRGNLYGVLKGKINAYSTISDTINYEDDEVDGLPAIKSSFNILTDNDVEVVHRDYIIANTDSLVHINAQSILSEYDDYDDEIEQFFTSISFADDEINSYKELVTNAKESYGGSQKSDVAKMKAELDAVVNGPDLPKRFKLDSTFSWQGVSFGKNSSWYCTEDEGYVNWNIDGKEGEQEGNDCVTMKTATKGQTRTVEDAWNTYFKSGKSIEELKSWDNNGLTFQTGVSSNEGVTWHLLAVYDKNTDKGLVLSAVIHDSVLNRSDQDAFFDELVKTVSFDPEATWTDYQAWSGEGAGSESSSDNSIDKYKPGVYLIGSDLPAGEYAMIAQSSSVSAYYCVYPDTSKSDIIGNNNFELIDYVTVSDGQLLEVSRATIVPANQYSVDALQYLVGSGRFRVGKDIPAGTYKLEVNTSRRHGYYAVYNSSLPDADIVQNNNFENNDYVTIYEGQYLEISGCKATLT